MLAQLSTRTQFIERHYGDYYSSEEYSDPDLDNDFTFDKAKTALASSSTTLRRNSQEAKTTKIGFLFDPSEPVWGVRYPEERILWIFPSSWVIIPKQQPLLEAWDLLIDFSSILTVFWTPYALAFMDPSGDLLLDFPMTMLFSMDCILYFFKAYPLPGHPGNHWYETKPSRIAKNYLRGWFVVDLLCAAPLDQMLLWICSQLGQEPNRFIVAAVRLLRLLRLCRIAKIQRHLAQLRYASGMRVADFKLCGLAFSTMVACHWIACLWGSIGQSGSLPTGRAAEVTDGTPWMDKFAWLGPDTNHRTPMRMYLVSFYWACVTLTSIGYGDITPGTTAEYIVCIMIMCLGSSVWAYVIGAICGVIADMDPQRRYFEEHMDALNVAMHGNEVPRTLQWKSREYLQESRPMMQRISGEDVFRELSPALRGEVQVHCMRVWLGEESQVSWIRALDFEVKVTIAEAATQTLYAPLQIVEVIGAADEPAMHFLRRGMVWKSGACLKSGAVWGEDIILHNSRLHDKTTARAFMYSEIFTLTKRELNNLRQASPKEWSVIRPFHVRMAARRGFIVEAHRRKTGRRVPEHLIFTEHHHSHHEALIQHHETPSNHASPDHQEDMINRQLTRLMMHIDDRFASLQDRVSRIESSLRH